MVCFKASETLLGIETLANLANSIPLIAGFKASETLLGIETNSPGTIDSNYRGFKASETLLGIETLL